MSLADACIVRMTEISARHAVLTLDSDFTIYRNMTAPRSQLFTRRELARNPNQPTHLVFLLIASNLGRRAI